MLHIVVETPEFIKQAKKCMDDESKNEFITFIAANPMAGDIIRNTRGARKIRWKSDNNQGKSGGVRVIYCYHNRFITIFLLTVYGKNKKANLTKAEQNVLQKITKQIFKLYGSANDE